MSFCLYVDSVQGEERIPIDMLLSGRDKVAITNQLNNVANLLEPKSAFAKNLVIVGTPATLSVLGLRHRVDLSVEDYETLVGKTYRAYLEFDGLNLLQGEATLEIKKIKSYHIGQAVQFECYITGTRYVWASKFKDMTVQSLYDVWPNHTKEDTVVRNSWDRQTYPDNYIGAAYYPFYYGAFRFYDRVHLHDLHAHPYIVSILEYAAQKLGYTLTGQFYHSKEFRGLTVPAHFPTVVDATSSQFEDATLIIDNNFVEKYYRNGDRLDQINPLVDVNPTANQANPNWDNPEQGAFTFEYPGVYRITVEANGSNSVVGSYFRMKVTSKLKGVLADQVLPGGPGGNATVTIPYDYYQVGDIIYTEFVNVGDADNIYTINGTGSAIRIEPTVNFANYPVSTVLNPSHNLPPDVTVADILAGVAHIYGLYAVTDGVNKTIRLVPSLNYYDLSQGEDITAYVDQSEPVEEDPPLDACKNIYLKYRDAQDNLAKELEDEIGKPLYGEKAPTITDECTDVRTNPTFAPTWYVSYCEPISGDFQFPAAFDKTDGLYNPLSGDALEDYLDEDIGLRILYFEGLANNNPNPPGGLYNVHNPGILSYDSGNGAGIQAINEPLPYAYMADTLRAYPQNLGDHFNFDGNQKAVYLGYDSSEVWSSQYPTGELARTYRGAADHWYYLLKTVQANRRKFRALVNMDPLKFLSLDFSTVKYLNLPLLGGGQFLLNSVDDYDPETQKGFIELVQFNPPPPTCPTDISYYQAEGFPWITGTNFEWFEILIPDGTGIIQSGQIVNYGVSYFIDDSPTPYAATLTEYWDGSFNFGSHTFVFVASVNQIPAPISTIPQAGQPQRKIKLVGSLGFTLPDGRVCPFSFCYTAVFDPSGTLVQEKFGDFCADQPLEIPTLTETCCFENLVETIDSLSNPNSLPNSLSGDRYYEIQAFTVNGINVYPGVVGATSPTINSSTGTVNFINCIGYGLATCSPSPSDGLTANNYRDIFDFLNGLNLGFVSFQPSGRYRCVEYAPGFSFSLRVAKVGGSGGYYDIVYDGLTVGVDYYIGPQLYNVYREECFTLGSSLIQAIATYRQVPGNDLFVEIDLQESIRPDGQLAGTFGRHTWTIQAYRLDNGQLIPGTDFTLDGNGTAAIPGATLTAMRNAWGVQAVTGSYSKITVVYNGAEPGIFIPNQEQVLTGFRITSHVYTFNAQSDAATTPTDVPGLVIGTYGNTCIRNFGTYPVFQTYGVGGIIEIHTPAGVGGFGTQVDNIFLRIAGSNYAADEYPQAPGPPATGIVTSYSYDNTPSALQPFTAPLPTVQGPTSGPYATSGVPGDLISLFSSQFGLSVVSDSIYDFRLLQFGVSASGTYWRISPQFTTDVKPKRLRIERDDNSGTYYILQIEYTEALTFGGVVFVSTGQGGQ